MVVTDDHHKGGHSMSHYHHLTISEREYIWENKFKGKSIHAISAGLGRNVATVSRELKRNSTNHGYRPSEAQAFYTKRRGRCRRRRILEQSELRDKVVAILTEEQWSPEEISNRFRLENSTMSVSYPTIYRALHAGLMEPKGARKNRHGHYPMQKHLRRKGHKPKGKQRKTQSFVHQTIETRPQAAQDRSEFGHWEGDLVYSSFHKLYIVTMVDRRSRYLITGISYSRRPSEVADVITSMLQGLPSRLVRSITLDRGVEFADHASVTRRIPYAQFYFAHPHAPWERGMNENTNGLLRQYVPKTTYKVPFSPELLVQFTDKLNRRPRKCLAWLSPFECLFHSLLHFT